MSIELNLRYQKRDQFRSEIFIASPKYDDELPAFEKLKKLEVKLNAKKEQWGDGLLIHLAENSKKQTDAAQDLFDTWVKTQSTSCMDSLTSLQKREFAVEMDAKYKTVLEAYKTFTRELNEMGPIK